MGTWDKEDFIQTKEKMESLNHEKQESRTRKVVFIGEQPFLAHKSGVGDPWSIKTSEFLLDNHIYKMFNCNVMVWMWLMKDKCF